MLKEIDYWLKMSHTSGSSGINAMTSGAFLGLGGATLKRVKKNDIIDFNDGINDSQDDQIQMSKMIHSTQIDYMKTF